MKRKKILFVKNYYANPKFITNDLDILRTEYDVTLQNVKNRKNALIIFSLIKQSLYLFFNTWRYDLLYIWFADYHSFLPVLYSKIFFKKSIICAGGYESTYIPEINMGVFTNASLSKSVRAFVVRFSLKHCNYILPVDETLIEHTNNYIYSDTPGKAPLHDGIKKFIPGIKTNFKTMYLGYDPELFKKPADIQKQRAVVSAGLIVNEDEFRRKGFDLLLEASALLPDVKFILIGFNEYYLNKFQKTCPPNVEMFGIVTYAKLIEKYSIAKVYAQFSMFEGMPSSICEAMLCECIPVGSDVNGIPKIIDDCGVIIKNKNAGNAARAIETALAMEDNAGTKARNYIVENFNYQLRSRNLLELVQSLI